jgi:hypothetical protein
MASKSKQALVGGESGILAPDDCVCITVGVTAHRNLAFANEQTLRAQVRDFFEDLWRQFPHLPVKLLNPLAEGGDRLVAEVARELGISLIVPLPMPLAEYEKDFKSAESLQQFRDLCAQGEVTELPVLEGATLESLAENPAARSLQYAQMGVFISSHSQILLALWDGEPGLKTGGTGSVIHFHLHDSMPGYLESDETAQLLADSENDLVYHVSCPRSAAAEPQAPGWLSHQGELRSTSMPQAYSSVLKNLQTFALDAIRHRQALRHALSDSGAMERQSDDRELGTIEQLFVYADWLAVHYRKRVILGFRTTHTVAVLMGLCFILYSEYDGLSFLLPVFLLLFFSAYVLNRLTGARQWHRKYLDYRALAEGLRVQFYWTLAGVQGQGNRLFVYDNILQKQDIELVWIRHIMRNSLVLRLVPGVLSDERLQRAIDEWVGNEEGSSGQIEYYQRTASVREAHFDRTNAIGRACLWLGMGTAVFLALVGEVISGDVFTLLLVLMGVLPLVAGVREAYAFKKADRELVKQYRFMAHLFGRARKKLAAADSASAKRKLLHALGEACLEEHAEWLLMHRERPLEHPGLQT